jgi:hypothetical protein
VPANTNNRRQLFTFSAAIIGGLKSQMQSRLAK